jgi:hypothetical protein
MGILLFPAGVTVKLAGSTPETEVVAAVESAILMPLKR